MSASQTCTDSRHSSWIKTLWHFPPTVILNGSRGRGSTFTLAAFKPRIGPLSATSRVIFVILRREQSVKVQTGVSGLKNSQKKKIAVFPTLKSLHQIYFMFVKSGFVSVCFFSSIWGWTPSIHSSLLPVNYNLGFWFRDRHMGFIFYQVRKGTAASSDAANIDSTCSHILYTDDFNSYFRLISEFET